MRIGITYDIQSDYPDAGEEFVDFSSFETIEFIRDTLVSQGHTVELIGGFKKLCSFIAEGGLERIDIVFNTAEGIKSRNREGFIPSLLEGLGFPYVGSDAYALGLTLNKMHTKVMCRHLGIPTAEYYEIRCEADLSPALEKIGLPCVLKPNLEGTSGGVVLVRDEEKFSEEANKLLGIYGPGILCEEYIDGREVVVPIIGTGEDAEVIGVVELVRKNGEPIEIFSLDDKLGDTVVKALPQISEELRRDITEASLLIHNYLGCADYNRIDFRLTADGGFSFIELNALPDMGEHSGYILGCTLYGRDYAKTFDEIIQRAAARWKRN